MEVISQREKLDSDGHGEEQADDHMRRNWKEEEHTVKIISKTWV